MKYTMPFHAIDAGAMDQLPQRMQNYLKHCGMWTRTINKCNLKTKLYHDHGIYGDIADGYMSVLSDLYQVNLSHFDFDKLTPWKVPFNHALPARGHRQDGLGVLRRALNHRIVAEVLAEIDVAVEAVAPRARRARRRRRRRALMARRALPATKPLCLMPLPCRRRRNLLHGNHHKLLFGSAVRPRLSGLPRPP